MKTLLPLFVVMLLISNGWIVVAQASPIAQVSANRAGLGFAARRAVSANLDEVADRVFGQPDFVSNAANNGGLGPASLHQPVNTAIDAKGHLYVADYRNNRVLEFDNPLSSGAADRVFGQPDFISNAINTGGLSARSLNQPIGVAVDPQGNLYVADSGNNRVLFYHAPLAKTGPAPAADLVFGQPDFITNTANTGGVSAISLHSPGHVAVDLHGVIYVDDTFNNRVLGYFNPNTSDPPATMVFGQPGFISNTANNGGVSATSLDDPTGIALDTQENLYVTDGANNRVLEYNDPPLFGETADHHLGQPAFTSNTANNGGISNHSLSLPFGLAVDASQNVYVVDTGNNRVLEFDTPIDKVSQDPPASRVFGQPDFSTNTSNTGGLSAASLSVPTGASVDPSGNLYVSDQNNNRVLEYDLPVPNAAPLAALLSPSTLAAGSPAFTLTVNGEGFVSSSVVRWNGSDRPTTYVSGAQIEAAISASDIAAAGPFAVTVFTPSPGGGASNLVNLALYARVGQDTVADTELGQPNFLENTFDNPHLPGAAGQVASPNGLAIDPRSGRLFLADAANSRVLSWPDAQAQANGQAADLVIGQPDLNTTSANTGGINANTLSIPSGLALDNQGNLYVADSDNSRVLAYRAPLVSGMAASKVFGQGGNFTTRTNNNGGVSANSLDIPRDVAVDPLGNLYVADTSNNRVLEYDTPLAASGDTTADRVFGQPGFTTNDNNHGGVSAEALAAPYGVAVDLQGDLFVADLDNNRVLVYHKPLSSGTADLVIGQLDFTSKTPNNGGPSASTLFGPSKAALDTLGDLYVADENNNRMLEYDSPFTSGMSARRVFGQPDFSTILANQGGLSASSLELPDGVALDAWNNLYIADAVNNRVLEYDWAAAKVYLPITDR